MARVTQDMKYRQSLICFAQKYGVSRASRKYNRPRSSIYFWLSRYDGTIESLADRSKRPHSHPNQHTEAELKLIRDMRRRNPALGLSDLWCRLRERGYTRCPESLFRVLKRLGKLPEKPVKQPYTPKPCQQMTYPGERVQLDVKVVPRACCKCEERLYQYTAIDEFTRLRYLAAYNEQSTFSSADFLKKAYAFFKHHGFTMECVQTDNGLEFTKRFCSYGGSEKPTIFQVRLSEYGIRHKLIRPFTPRHNGKVERSHRKDNERFYATHTFYSFEDFSKQLTLYNRRDYNNFPMHPLNWKTPKQVLMDYLASM